MAKHIVYVDPDQDNLVIVITPTPDGRRAGESQAEWLQRIAIKRVPANALRVRVVDTNELPASRRFREAWRLRPNSQIEVNLARAKELLAEEIPRRTKATAQKVAAIRLGIAQSSTVDELEALVNLHGWKTAIRAIKGNRQPGEEGEDL